MTSKQGARSDLVPLNNPGNVVELDREVKVVQQSTLAIAPKSATIQGEGGGQGSRSSYSTVTVKCKMRTGPPCVIGWHLQ